MEFKKNYLPMNLQMFAEDEVDKPETEDKPEESKPDGTEFKPFESQSELDAHTNKAIHTALENYKKKNATDVQTAIDEALKKEKSYSEMSEEERKIAELTDREAQLEKRASELEFKELLADISTDLASKELPVKFADMLAVAGDKEKSLANVTEFEKEFKAHVAEGVKKALRQSDPGTGAGGTKQTNYGAELAKNKAGNKKPF